MQCVAEGWAEAGAQGGARREARLSIRACSPARMDPQAARSVLSVISGMRADAAAAAPKSRAEPARTRIGISLSVSARARWASARADVEGDRARQQHGRRVRCRAVGRKGTPGAGAHKPWATSRRIPPAVPSLRP